MSDATCIAKLSLKGKKIVKHKTTLSNTTLIKINDKYFAACLNGEFY
jgi:hypothetical protein